MCEEPEPISLPALPAVFSGELHFENNRKVLNVNGAMLRQDLWHDEKRIETIIYRPDIEVLWRLTDDRHASEIPLQTEDADRIRSDIYESYLWTRQELIEVDGGQTLKFSGEGPDRGQVECLVDVQSGMRLKMTFYDERGDVCRVEEWRNVCLTPPPVECFELPEGVVVERMRLRT
ncbi:MAG: hypothetical protein ACYTGL_25505 [Planctomycetota bacterium]|jgi:hypothetical protein